MSIGASFVNTTTFTVSGTHIDTFHTGRRLRLYEGPTKKYGTIVSGTYDGGPDKTTIVLSANSDDITSALTTVEFGIVSSANSSIPVHAHSDDAVGGILDLSDNSSITTISGNLQTQIDDNTTLISTTSGTLQTDLDTHTHFSIESVDNASNRVRCLTIAGEDYFYAQLGTGKAFLLMQENDITLSSTTGTSITMAEDTSISLTVSGTRKGFFNVDGFKLQSGTSIKEFSTDGTMVGDSDNTVPTEKAIKLYTDTELTNASGTLQTQITANAISISSNDTDITNLDTKIDSTSGTLQTQIDGKDTYTSWSFAVDGATKDAITSADVLDFVSGDNITITRSAEDKITISGTPGGGSANHSELNELDYASAGHTGFASASALATTSGDLQTNIDAKDNYTSWAFAVDGVTKDSITSADILNFVGGDNITITRSAEDEITISGASAGGAADHAGLINLSYAASGHTGFASSTALSTTSGTLQTQIDGKASYLFGSNTFSGTGDIHAGAYYGDGSNLTGVIASVSGADHATLDNLDYASAGHTGFQASGDYATNADVNQNTWDIAIVSGTVDTHIAATTSVHGITDTSDLALSSELASTVSGSEGSKLIGYKDGDTIKEILDETINAGVLKEILITDDGGTDVSWGTGEVYTTTGDIINISSGSATVTDNTVEYLVWTTGSTVALQANRADIHSGEIEVGHVHTSAGDILNIHQAVVIGEIMSSVTDALAHMFPIIVTEGLVVSEHAGDDAFDLECTSGSYSHDGHDTHSVPGFDSTVTPIHRHYHVSGVPTTDTNSQIDAAFWDNGTDKTAVNASKFYKHLVLVDSNMIHYVYPDVEYGTVAAAITGPLPTIPGGLEHTPTIMAIVLRGSDTALPAAGSDQWIDERITLTTAPAGTISDHGNLTGLSDDDHTQYLLVDGSRALAGPWDMGSQALTNVNIDGGTINGATITGDVSGSAGTVTGTVQTAITTCANLTTVGTIGAGVWEGTPIADGYISSAATWNAKQDSLTFGIADTNSVVIDDADAADDDYAKLTASGIEGRSYTEVRSDINVADGADVTGSNAPQAHKDLHDPNDGSDALDTANAAEISVVVASGTGTSHSFARADHVHAINHAITDNHLVTVDGSDNAWGYAQFTTDGLRGRSASEAKDDLGLSFSKSITVEDPTDSEDLTIFYTNIAITVVAIEGVIRGATSVDVNIIHSTDRSAAGNDICTADETVSNTTTGVNFTLGGDTTIPASSFIWLETSALSGAPDELHVTIRYTED